MCIYIYTYIYVLSNDDNRNCANFVGFTRTQDLAIALSSPLVLLLRSPVKPHPLWIPSPCVVGGRVATANNKQYHVKTENNIF